MKTIDHYDIIADVEKMIVYLWKREDLTKREKQISAAMLEDVIVIARGLARNL